MSIRSGSWSRFPKPVFLWLAGVLVLWLVTPVIVGFWIATPLVVSWIPSYPPGGGGVFGDQFGAINSLFTGLAFVGTVWAIYHQRASSEAENVAALTMYLMDSGRQRERGTVRKLLEQHLRERQKGDANGDWRVWPKGAAPAVRQVCGQYNYAGLLIKSGAVPREYLAELADLPKRVYELVVRDTKFLADMKAREGSSRFHNFEWLVEQLPSEGLGEGNPAEFEELAGEDTEGPSRVDVAVRVEPVRADYRSGSVAVGLIAATLLYTLYTRRRRRE